MPLCLVYTSMKRTDLGEDFEERMAKSIADATHEPVEHVFVFTKADMPSFCAGTREPAMTFQLHCKKIFNEAANLKPCYSKLFETLKETTKLPGNRIVIELISVPDEMAQLGD